MQRRLSTTEEEEEENEEEEDKQHHQQSDEEEKPVKKSKGKSKKEKNKSPRVRCGSEGRFLFCLCDKLYLMFCFCHGENQRPKARPSINREVSNEFRPSPWITDVIPRKSPFVPQMGDEVKKKLKYVFREELYSFTDVTSQTVNEKMDCLCFHCQTYFCVCVCVCVVR